MKLKALLAGLPVTVKNVPRDLEITGLCSHSDLVVPGNLFIAKKKAAEFVSKAVAIGAAAVVTDIYNPFLGVPQVIHPYPELLEAKLASRFYGFPSEKLALAGVTGTNGKTSVSYIIRHIITANKQKCGLLGTIEYDTGSSRRNATLTTPDLLTTQKFLSEMVRAGCSSGVMEVSSHGLVQGRVSEITFKTAIFTNLTQDHLDYHANMDEYARAKSLLFAALSPSSVAILNGDDPYVEVMKHACRGSSITFGRMEKNDVQFSIEESSLAGTHFSLKKEGRKYGCFTPLVGLFNAYNSVAALLGAEALGIPLGKSIEALRTFPGVPGRLQKISQKKNVHIYVDFAHTEDAIENVLTTLRPLTKGKLIIVFGCGGNRDKEKRPKMGRVATEYADFAIITSDNPRTENPETICREIEAGVGRLARYEVIVERRDAIEKAVHMAKGGDVIVVAGRGHEPMQHFGRHSIPFLDADVIQEILKERVVLA